MKTILPGIYLVVLFLPGCHQSAISERQQDGDTTLYRDILLEIVTEQFLDYCLNSEVASMLDNDLRNRQIDSGYYSNVLDSLRSEIRDQKDVCLLEYTDQFQILSKGYETSGELNKAIKQSLAEPSGTKWFSGISLDSIVSTLSKANSRDVQNFSLGFMKIIPYKGLATKPFGGGIGVFAISDVYLNSDKDKAILYYEFNCGPTCGNGVIVFMERVKMKWKLASHKNIWYS